MSTGKRSRKHQFQDIIDDAGIDWANIDTLRGALEAGGFFDDEFLDKATTNAKNAEIRRQIKQCKDSSGWPVFASVVTTNEEGVEERRYKQETLFDVEDYRKVVTYHAERSSYHKSMAKGYARRCRERHDVQIRLSFGD